MGDRGPLEPEGVLLIGSTDTHDYEHREALQNAQDSSLERRMNTLEAFEIPRGRQESSDVA